MSKKIELYHGTNSVFDEFDPEKLNADCAVDQYGSGFYFFDSAAPTIRYGQIVVIAECEIKKVLDSEKTHKHSLSFNQIEELILQSPDLDMGLSNFGDVDYDGFDRVLHTAVNIFMDQDILQALNALGNDFFPKEKCHILLRKFVELTGYNCIKKQLQGYSIYVMLDVRDIEIKKVISNEQLP